MRATKRSRVAILLLSAALVGSSCTALGIGGTGCDGTAVLGIFEQIGDLPRAANVQSADVEIGTVKDIQLDGWNAHVSMCINPGERVPADVRAVVRTTSLLGEKFIDLQPQSFGPPYLEDGATLDLDQTSKATELEDVFAKLAAVLGTGNLEKINRFTTAQANILRDHTDELREVLSKLRRFTDVLADRKTQISSAVDSLDAVARTIVADSKTLRDFLTSFADSSRVLADNKKGLQSLLLALDRFSNVSAQLLIQTERGVNEQFEDLRPVLRVVVGDTARLRETLTTLATFTEYFPETMPGDYLQLDVCQAAPDHYEQGTTCPQSVANDDPGLPTSSSAPDAQEPLPSNSVEYILRLPLVGVSRDG